jgi:hypothetical protein
LPQEKPEKKRWADPVVLVPIISVIIAAIVGPIVVPIIMNTQQPSEESVPTSVTENPTPRPNLTMTQTNPSEYIGYFIMTLIRGSLRSI